mmetsp:Transcript_90652/g.253276  ORF Transcript_90652/g.253276 Transcript_90652/m.253276 type:complete len:206 (-) Transcript_90652:1334-1951(-)
MALRTTTTTPQAFILPSAVPKLNRSQHAKYPTMSVGNTMPNTLHTAFTVPSNAGEISAEKRVSHRPCPKTMRTQTFQSWKMPPNLTSEGGSRCGGSAQTAAKHTTAFQAKMYAVWTRNGICGALSTRSAVTQAKPVSTTFTKTHATPCMTSSGTTPGSPSSAAKYTRMPAVTRTMWIQVSDGIGTRLAAPHIRGMTTTLASPEIM